MVCQMKRLYKKRLGVWLVELFGKSVMAKIEGGVMLPTANIQILWKR